MTKYQDVEKTIKKLEKEMMDTAQQILGLAEDDHKTRRSLTRKMFKLEERLQAMERRRGTS